ncbi:MAG: hypothetical protein K6U00_05265 [Armatimonadetes bacterium]|nr:hypothetical protein [Armatimonadota bacterium]
MKHSTRLIKGGSTAESHEYAVKSVDYYKAPSPEELSVQFPSGTRVKLMDDGTEIVIP